MYKLLLVWLVHLVMITEGNLRCYSCAPCNELELYAGDVTHFEQDCYLDRYCMKVSPFLFESGKMKNGASKKSVKLYHDVI